MSYIESTDEAEMDRIEEALGRRRAQELGKPFPMPPDTVGPGKQPPDLGRYYTRYYRRFYRHRSGGVLLVDERMRGWDGENVELGDRTTVQLDVTVRERTRAQLSDDSRSALNSAGVSDREPDQPRVR